MRKYAVTTLAIALATPAGAGALTPGPEVLRLGGSTHIGTARTRQRTSPNAWYTVTVSGVVAYNGRGTFADCGHRDGSDEADWYATGYPLLDGVPSPCATRMTARASHTYCWRQRGTGGPLVFTWVPWATADDYGALVIAIDSAPGPAVVRDDDCAVLD
jgi:hypothetical protein